MTLTKKQQEALDESGVEVYKGFLRFDKNNRFDIVYETDPEDILYPEIPKTRTASWFAMMIRYLAAGYKLQSAYYRVKTYYPDLKYNTARQTIQRLRKNLKGKGISFPPTTIKGVTRETNSWFKMFMFRHAGNPNISLFVKDHEPLQEGFSAASGEPSRAIGKLTRKEAKLLKEIREAGKEYHDKAVKQIEKAKAKKKSGKKVKRSVKPKTAEKTKPSERMANPPKKFDPFKLQQKDHHTAKVYGAPDIPTQKIEDIGRVFKK
ncbi:MAG: hypothetical protein OCU12_08020 [Methanophagales archaeon]|nr:hypothetical protein [Methanophagales archaeon]